jgi:hypothetical protein
MVSLMPGTETKHSWNLRIKELVIEEMETAKLYLLESNTVKRGCRRREWRS